MNDHGHSKPDKVTASIEWLVRPSGILRVHSEGGVYGDAYNWCCTVEISGDMAMLHGTLTAPSQSQFRAIQEALRNGGFKSARWIRVGKAGSGRRKSAGRNECLGRREVVWEIK